MKLVILGANGRTGKLVVGEALARGDTVTAVVRSEAKRLDIEHERLTVVIGDPCDPKFLATVFRNHDAAISTLGGRLPTKTALAVYWRSADAITEAAWDAGLRKVVATSSALLFPRSRVVDKVLALIVRNVVRSATQMEQRLQTAHLDVVVARCGFLTTRNDTRYRAELGALPRHSTTVSRWGLATFLVDAVHQQGSGYQVFGVSGPEP